MSGIFTADAQGKANPILQPSQLPYGAIPFDKVTPADYDEAVKEGMKRHQQEIDAIVNNPEAPTFENTIVAYDRSGKDLGLAVLALGTWNTPRATLTCNVSTQNLLPCFRDIRTA